MTIDNITLGLVAIIFAGAREVWLLLIRKFWKKTVEADYVTVEVCQGRREDCRLGRDEKDAELLKLIKEMQKEQRRGYELIDALHVDFIDHMLFSGTPKEVISGLLKKRMTGGRHEG